MIYDPDDTCHYCGHEKGVHEGEPLPWGCLECNCYWFVSESAWEAEGRRAEVPHV